jgi:hypothetical protein
LYNYSPELTRAVTTNCGDISLFIVYEIMACIIVLPNEIMLIDYLKYALFMNCYKGSKLSEIFFEIIAMLCKSNLEITCARSILFIRGLRPQSFFVPPPPPPPLYSINHYLPHLSICVGIVVQQWFGAQKH